MYVKGVNSKGYQEDSLERRKWMKIKRKYSSIFGVLLALVLAVSLIVVAAPPTADGSAKGSERA